MATLELITSFKYKNLDICIFRDTNGKWWVKVDGITTQKYLNASEIVRWFSNLCENNS